MTCSYIKRWGLDAIVSFADNYYLPLKINEGKVELVNEAVDVSTFVHDVAKSFTAAFLSRQL